MQEPANMDVLYATLAAALAAEPPPLRIDADGIIRVGSTRVTIDTVIGAYQEGASAEEIALAYDALQLPEIHAALGFYLLHRSVVEEYLAQRQQLNDAVRKENELRWPADGVRERLLSRRRRAS